MITSFLHMLCFVCNLHAIIVCLFVCVVTRQMKHPEDLDRQERGGFSFDYIADVTQMKTLDISPTHMNRYFHMRNFVQRQYDQRLVDINGCCNTY